MQSVRKRVEELEAAMLPSGMLVKSWAMEGGHATAEHEGVLHRQADDESVEQFLQRVGARVGRQVVWASEVDMRL